MVQVDRRLRERKNLLANNTELKGNWELSKLKLRLKGKTPWKMKEEKEFVISKNKHEVSVDVSRILSTTIVSITTASFKALVKRRHELTQVEDLGQLATSFG